MRRFSKSLRSLLGLHAGAVVALVLAELLLIVAATWALSRGSATLAGMALVAPFGLVLLLRGFDSDRFIFSTFAVLLPIAGIALLPSAVSAVGIALLVVVLAFKHLTGAASAPGARGSGGRAVVLLLVLTCAAVAASFLRGWGSVEQLQVAVSVVPALAIAALPAVTSLKPGDLVRPMTLLAVVHAVTCLLVPFLAVTSDLTTGSKWIVTPFGQTSTNLFGFFVAPTALLLLGMVRDEQRPGRKTMLLVASGLVFVALVFTRSRGAWAGFGLGLLYLVVRMRSWRLAFASGAAALLGMAFDAVKTTVGMRVAQTGLADPAMAGRLLLWRSALQAIAANWFLGMGLREFRLRKFLYGFPALLDRDFRFHSHSYYLEVAVSIGVAGALVLFFIHFRSLFKLDRAIARSRESVHLGFACGLAAALVAFAVHGLVETPAWHVPSMAYWGLLVGTGAIVARGLTADSSLASERSTAGAGTAVSERP